MSKTDFFVARHLAQELRQNGCGVDVPYALPSEDQRILVEHEALAAFDAAKEEWAGSIRDLYSAVEKHRRSLAALKVADDAARFEAFKIRHLRSLYDAERVKEAAADRPAMTLDQYEATLKTGGGMKLTPCRNCKGFAGQCSCLLDAAAAQKANAAAMGDVG